jgi:hypothetical protein
MARSLPLPALVAATAAILSAGGADAGTARITIHAASSHGSGGTTYGGLSPLTGGTVTQELEVDLAEGELRVGDVASTYGVVYSW